MYDTGFSPVTAGVTFICFGDPANHYRSTIQAEQVFTFHINQLSLQILCVLARYSQNFHQSIKTVCHCFINTWSAHSQIKWKYMLYTDGGNNFILYTYYMQDKNKTKISSVNIDAFAIVSKLSKFGCLVCLCVLLRRNGFIVCILKCSHECVCVFFFFIYFHCISCHTATKYWEQ